MYSYMYHPFFVYSYMYHPMSLYVAPDQFASSDVSLVVVVGASSLVAMGVPTVGGESMHGHAVGELFLCL